MCGIVGYLGPMNPQEIIINGLRKLEYRGYDSAGIAILEKSGIRRVRAQGKLKALEEKLKSESLSGHLGIGHTRWATHGVPSERNAHPHQSGGISLVHNGIIENYAEIREQLQAQGVQLTSDTDSELVAHLIAIKIQETKDLYQAVEGILDQLKGAFSILAIWDQQPDLMVAFKDGPPLVIGLGEGQNFVASDVQALLQYTKKFIYLEDREIAKVEKHKVSVFSAAGFPIQKKVTEINWSPDLVEKQGYPHYMLKEIYEQPRSVAAAMEPHLDLKLRKIQLQRVGFSAASVQELESLDLEKDAKITQQIFRQVDRITIVACGTSYYAGMYGKYLIESLSKIPTEVDIASEFRYRNPLFSKNHLVVTISQSGETADTLAALRMAKEAGVQTLSICNVKNSSIDREAHGHLYMNAGPEIGVASTKAFVATMTILQILALGMAQAREALPMTEEKKYVDALTALPSQMEVVLAYDKYFAEAATVLKKFRGFLYMGRGVNYPIALEGALKLKELAYLHAEGYAAGEMKHGPLALIDNRMAIIMLAPSDELYDKTVSNLEEVKARGGQIISLGTGENQKLSAVSERYLSLPSALGPSNPFLEVIPLQLLAYHLASSLGHDVDQPRNLAKSVTVE